MMSGVIWAIKWDNRRLFFQKKGARFTKPDTFSRSWIWVFMQNWFLFAASRHLQNA
jgi:hypothetical protein